MHHVVIILEDWLKILVFSVCLLLLQAYLLLLNLYNLNLQQCGDTYNN